MLPDGKTLLDALAVAVYVTDISGKITYFNDAAAALWGRRPQLGVDTWCGSWKLYWPDGTPMPRDECPMAIALKESVEPRGVEAIAERPDGSRVRFLPFPTLLRDGPGATIGAINILMDISEPKAAETDSARLAAIVTFSDDAIVSKSLDGTIMSWNAGAAHIFGYTEDEMIGRSITTIVPGELHDEEREILARLKAGEHINHYETVRVAKNGRRIDISLSVSPIRDRTGRIVGASKVARDISERKLNEKMQTQLVGELHHRIRNTLATVQAVATQSLRYATDPEHFVAAFTARVDSLSRAHSLLTNMKWEGVELAALIHDQIMGTPEDDRISCSGPRLFLPVQMALHLAMALHELATNARQHGALAAPGGRLVVEWELRAKPATELQLNWREVGGPSVSRPKARGFGTRLIEESLSAHRGRVTADYEKDGLVCAIVLPMAHLFPVEPISDQGIALTNLRAR